MAKALVHTHGPRPGAGINRIKEYKRDFREMYENRVLSKDVSRVTLQIDDEDARYTTDPMPGMFDKLRCVEILMRLRKYPRNKPMEVSVWDVYSAPGMDVLYSMLVPYALHNVKMSICAVSIVEDAHDMARFKRMEHNIHSLKELIPNFGSIEAFKSSARNFCEEFRNMSPDILLVSPPWMTSRGEMRERHIGLLRSAEDLMEEVEDLLQFCKPKVISLMTPYNYDETLRALPDHSVLRSKYGMVQSIYNEKRFMGMTNQISSYYVHILALNYKKRPKKTAFVYYV